MAQPEKSTLADRMDGDYRPPILAEPGGGPIPEWSGDEPDVQAAAGDGQAEVIQRQWQQARERLLKRWPKTAQPMVEELAAQAEAAMAGGDLAQIGDLAVSAGVIAAVATPLRGTASDLAADAAAGVVAEAANQGVSITAAGMPGAKRVRQTADAVARIIASGYASGAARTALQLAGSEPADVRAAVEAHLIDVGASSNGLVGDNVGALLAAAQHAGRLAVLEQHPADAYRANEHNDQARCVKCSAVSGTEYGTLREAIADYPTAGFKACLGGGRCRGFVAPIWR